jgi:hypothetical protein
MKKIRLLLTFSFILLLFSGNAIATLSLGTYYLEGGRWQKELDLNPRIISAESLIVGNWSIVDMEEVSLVFPIQSEWIPDPGVSAYYGEVIEIHEKGTLEFQLDGNTYYATIKSVVKWTAHISPDGSGGWEIDYGENIFSTMTGSIDGTTYNIIASFQGMDEGTRTPFFVEGTAESLKLYITPAPASDYVESVGIYYDARYSTDQYNTEFGIMPGEVIRLDAWLKENVYLGDVKSVTSAIIQQQFFIHAQNIFHVISIR